MLAFRHLVVSPYRRALLPHIDKLFDEQVLLGTGVGSRELLRWVHYDWTVLVLIWLSFLGTLPMLYSQIWFITSGMISHRSKRRALHKSIRGLSTTRTSLPAFIPYSPR